MRLLKIAFALVPLLLASCATGDTQLKTVITTASGVVTSINKILPALAPLLPPATAATIAADVSTAQTLLASLAATSQGDNGVTTLLQVENLLNDALELVAQVPGLPPQYATIVAAAAVLLPVIEVYANQLIPASAAPVKKAVKAKALRPTMTVEQAKSAIATP